MLKPNQKKGQEKTTSFISEGLELKGILKLEGGIRIDGKVEGVIESKSTLYFGESARIKGRIVTQSLVSNGRIDGEIYAADTVKVNRPGSLKGSVTTKNLILEKKVNFQGRCQLLSDVEPVKPEPEERNDPERAIPNRK